MKLIPSIVTIILLGSSAPTANAFTDVSEFIPYSTAIGALKNAEILEGYEDGSFKPGDTINRAEFLTIIHRAQPFNLNKKLYANCFPDVTDQWFADTVCRAKAEGIISGYPDGTFKPSKTIEFTEASKILALAYKQDVAQQNLWYKGYIEALDSNQVVPPSIDALAKQLTRAEMAEMIWRIAESKTSEPSTSYYNIKYPEVQVDFTSNTVQYASTCADLDAFTAELQEANTNQMYLMNDVLMAPMMNMRTNSVADGAVPESAMVADESFSETNVQVQGVDEADIVKTDGTYIYALQNNVLTITKANPANSLQIQAEYVLSQAENNSFYGSELYIQNGQIIVVGSQSVQHPQAAKANETVNNSASRRIAPGYFPGNFYLQQAQVRLYSFSESEGIAQERVVSIEGNAVTSRVINNTLYLVTNKGFGWHYPMPYAEATNKSTLPLFSDTATNTTLEPAVNCTRVAILPHIKQPQYVTVSSIPLDSYTAEVNKEVIVGNGENVYMSLKNLYIASTDWNYGWGRSVQSAQKTNVYRFAITDDSVAFKASGQVPGRILNQFSMDEYNDSFRIATTIDQSFGSTGFAQDGEITPSLNNLYALNLDLQQTGAVENIAPGERIYSVRFMGDRTYMVTFKKVDPFFVLDTSNPRDPKILGQLKIPGYSDYLHPYDRNHIIGFGKDAVAAKDQDFAWYQGMKVALFNVQDVLNPTLQASLSIGDRGTSSPLLQNHKALLFDKERNVLAFPITIHSLTDEQKLQNEDGTAWGEPTFQGAIVLDITEDSITERGRISHYTEADALKLGSYFYGKNIERIIRIGQHLYTLGTNGIHSFTEETLQAVDAVEFTVQEQTGYGVYPVEIMQ